MSINLRDALNLQIPGVRITRVKRGDGGPNSVELEAECDPHISPDDAARLVVLNLQAISTIPVVLWVEEAGIVPPSDDNAATQE